MPDQKSPRSPSIAAARLCQREHAFKDHHPRHERREQQQQQHELHEYAGVEHQRRIDNGSVNLSPLLVRLDRCRDRLRHVDARAGGARQSEMVISLLRGDAAARRPHDDNPAESGRARSRPRWCRALRRSPPARLSTPTGPPSNFSSIVWISGGPSRRTLRIDVEHVERLMRDAGVTRPSPLTSAKSRPSQQPIGDARRAAERVRLFGAVIVRDAHLKLFCRLRIANLGQRSTLIDSEALHDAEAIAQRRRQQTRGGWWRRRA